ncbi:MAG: sugar phosphate isomerase/epimerase family protein [Chloroflexota bacterium]|nr:sugar phosphate isomerase/epimerase [Dehalococcoidia bacterium]MDW8253240.1 sugar phosphate isomerase/epimerase family protein [Chloroflexota bacterium]
MSVQDLLGLNVSRVEHIRERMPALGLKRAELFVFSREELPEVRRALEEQGARFSVHTPVPRPRDYPYPLTWTFLNYADAERRDLYFSLVQETVECAADLGAEYVVVHYPGPITKACEEIGLARLFEIANESADRLAELSARTGVPIHLEGFGPSPFLNSEFILRVLERHPNLAYCFDVAHNHIADQRADLTYYEFLEALLPRLGSVHLWQTRSYEDYIVYRHLPLHPSQTPEEGWVDIERVVRTIHRAQPTVPFVMESPGRFPHPWQHLDYREGVRWLQEILATSS